MMTRVVPKLLGSSTRSQLNLYFHTVIGGFSAELTQTILGRNG